MIQLAQTLADGAQSVWKTLEENPDKVYFPNFGDGDNVLKSGIDVDRVMFTIPGTNFKIYWYGFLIALGIILAMIYGFRKMKKVGIDPDRATDAVIGGFFGAIIGARLYYIMFSSNLSIKDFFNFRDGGLAVYGGLIGAVIVGGIITRMKKIRLTAILDVVAPCFLIGQAIGRWGNFFNQEAFGTNTDKPWGMMSLTTANYVNNHITDGSVDPTLPIHPCFLYESLWCLAGFIILHLYFKHRKFDGEIILGYSALYGLGRFFIEGLRTDSLYIGSIRVSQLLAGLCFVASVIAIVVVRIIIAKNKYYVFFKDTELSREQILQYENAKRFEKEKKELKAKIAAAKAEDKDTAELEKEYEEQFGEAGKKKREQALIDAEQADIKAAAERKAKRSKAKAEDTDDKPESDEVKTEKAEAPAANTVTEAEKKTDEAIPEKPSITVEQADDKKLDNLEKSEDMTKDDNEPEVVAGVSEQLKNETDDLPEKVPELTAEKPEETIERTAEEVKPETAGSETETQDKPKQNNNNNAQKKNNNNRNRNNRNKNRSKNKGGNKQGGQNNRNNNKSGSKQGGNKNGQNKNNSNKPKGDNN